ncbi:MAG: transposase [Reichenbachiella sp.]
MDVTEINYQPFGQDHSYRLVVSRIKRKDQQANLFSATIYKYRSIITNNQEWSQKEIVSFYNKRGSSDRTFDALNNDFGWSKLPFSFLNQNTAFMIITSMYANFYRYMISCFSKKLSWLQDNFRLKKIVFRFVTVAAQWVKSGRQHILKLYTNKDYGPLA